MSADRYRAGKRLWSAEDDAVMRHDYPELPTPVVAAALRRTLPATYARAKELGLAKSAAYLASPHACRLRRGGNVGAEHRFKPGQAPANKGLRRPGWSAGRMRETQFKKGQPHNWKPIGSRRLVDGYVYIKLADVRHVPYTHNWYPEHVITWGYAHGRPLPPGHALRFKNGDRTDLRLDNLELVHRRELMARNTVHNLPAPLVQTIQLLGALTRQIRRKSRGQEQDRRPA